MPFNGGEGAGNYDGQTFRGDGCSSLTLSDIWAGHGLQTGIWLHNASDCVVMDCATWQNGDGSDTGTNAPDGMVATGTDSSSYSDNVQFVRCFVAPSPG